MSEWDDLADWLQLARTPKIGPSQFSKLIDRHGDAAAALRWLGTPQGLSRAGIERLHRRADTLAEIDATLEIGGQIVRRDDAEYPPWLCEIPDPPPVISLLGNPHLAQQPGIAVVGARNASGNGCRMARQLAAEVSQANITVVSGLARGIDTAAHQGGLDGPGSTIAVIASGLDIAYPAENRRLMHEIAERGLVVSERPLGAAPQARHFPRRNRIISGLSKAIVVVEAAEKSGSLMTARLGLEHGREVMAVPGSPMDARHRGTNKLLRDGAQMVESARDILDNLPVFDASPPPNRPAAPRRRAPTQPKTLPVESSPPQPADELSRQLYRLLSPVPLAVDELIRQCHASAGDVQEALLQLEIDGEISRHPGNRVALEVS